MDRPTRIVLADDQVLFVRSLEKVLTLSTEDIAVVGIAVNGKEAVDLSLRHRPDVVLMDVRMPELDGVEAARMIIRELPRCRVIMLTTFDDDAYVRTAISHGAAGYLLKDIPPEDLIASIRAVQSSTFLISPAAAHNLAASDSPSAPQSGGNAAPAEDFTSDFTFDFTSREQQILNLLLANMDNAAMAEKLFLSERTVRNYVSTIYAKFGVHSRLQLFQELERLKNKK